MTFVFEPHPDSRGLLYQVLLDLCCISGFVLGCFLFLQVVSSFSMMRGSLVCSMSIVTVICRVLFPFLFTAAAVYYSCPGIIWGLSFIKCTCLAVSSLFIFYCYGPCGWLIRLLLMFSEVFSFPAWYYFWKRCLFSCNRKLPSVCGVMLIYLLFLGIWEFYSISPFIQRLDIF